MTQAVVAGIETGGTKILARIADQVSGTTLAEGKWPTGSADQAGRDLIGFLEPWTADSRLTAVGIAAFGPVIVDPSSSDHGQMQPTTKPGWTGTNLRLALADRFGVPVTVDTDVNAAAIAEQRLGAGAGLPSVAYVTIGTGIGAGLALPGGSLKGAMHPEAGHFGLIRRLGDDVPSVCPFHASCAEGLVSGPAIRRRLGEGRDLADSPEVIDLTAFYLGQLAASLVLAWSPHRIIWGGGVIRGAPMLDRIEAELHSALGGYGVGPAIGQQGFCAPAAFDNSGLEGAVLMAREMAS